MTDQTTDQEHQQADQAKAPEQPQQDDNDFPLGNACDLSGEGTCEACQ